MRLYIYILSLLALLPSLGLEAQVHELRPYIETCPLIQEAVRAQALARLDSLASAEQGAPLVLKTSAVGSISPRLLRLGNNSPVLVVIHDLHPQAQVGDSYIGYYDAEWKNLGDMQLLQPQPRAVDFLPKEWVSDTYQSGRLLQLLSPLHLRMQWQEGGVIEVRPRLPLSLEDEANESVMHLVAQLKTLRYSWNGRELRLMNNEAVQVK